MLEHTSMSLDIKSERKKKKQKEKNSKVAKKKKKRKEKSSSLGGLEPPTFRLTAERANRLRHRDLVNYLRVRSFTYNVKNDHNCTL